MSDQLQQEAAKEPLGHRIKQPPVLVIFCCAGLFSCSFCWRFIFIFKYSKFIICSL